MERMSHQKIAERYFTISAALESYPLFQKAVTLPEGAVGQVIFGTLAYLREPRSIVKIRLEDGDEV